MRMKKPNFKNTPEADYESLPMIKVVLPIVIFFVLLLSVYSQLNSKANSNVSYEMNPQKRDAHLKGLNIEETSMIKLMASIIVKHYFSKNPEL